jgi:hypothetical protein
MYNTLVGQIAILLQKERKVRLYNGGAYKKGQMLGLPIAESDRSYVSHYISY